MAAKGPTLNETLKTLLVATDFSKGAEPALGRALRLPLAVGARIHVVHVTRSDIAAGARTNVEAEARRSLEQTLSRMTPELKPDAAPQLTSEILRGEAFVEIIRCSRRIEAELVVLGRHGPRPIRDMFIGTTAERVIRKGDVPVLIATLTPSRPYQRPLIATDLQDATRRTFDLALQIVGPYAGPIGVVQAFHVPFEGFITPRMSAREKSDYRRSFREQAVKGVRALLASYDGQGMQWDATVRQGDARSVILSEAVRRRADLIALGTHGRSGVAHALLGSVAEWVIAAAPCDVLVARPIRFSFELP